MSKFSLRPYLAQHGEFKKSEWTLEFIFHYFLFLFPGIGVAQFITFRRMFSGKQCSNHGNHLAERHAELVGRAFSTTLSRCKSRLFASTVKQLALETRGATHPG
jgi:hypothetical protein